MANTMIDVEVADLDAEERTGTTVGGLVIDRAGSVQDRDEDRSGDLPLVDLAASTESLRQYEAVVRGRYRAVILTCAAVTACVTAIAATVFGRTLGMALVALAAVGVVAGYRTNVRPWQRRWGASDAELTATMPGDELVERAESTTRAVNIDAPVGQVWAWIVELGIGPNGWNTRGLIDDGQLGGNRIVPRFRDLGCGRTGVMPGVGFEVHRIEAPHLVVSRGSDGTSWCLSLEDVGAGRTRLVSRFRFPEALPRCSEAGAFLLERRMLRTLKCRAESGAPQLRASTAYAP